MIKLKGVKHENVEINVQQSQVIDATMHIVRKNAGLVEGDWLDPVSNIIKYDDPYHRHGSICEYERGVATEEQQQAFLVLNYLEKLRHPERQ